MIDIIWNYREGFLRGISVTFHLTSLVWFFGLLGALVLVFIDTYVNLRIETQQNSINKKSNSLLKLFRYIRFIISFIFTSFGRYFLPGIPILVLLYWFHYPVQQELSTDLTAFTIAVIVLSIVNISSTSYIMKGIINDLPAKYIESARLCGLSKNEIFFKISLPLIFRSSIGPVLLVQLSMLHNSIFASLINVKDILWQAKLINSDIHKPIEIFTALALFFLIISIPIIIFSTYLKRKYTKNYTLKT